MKLNAFTMKPDGNLGKELQRHATNTNIRSKANQRAGMSKEEAITSFNRPKNDPGSAVEKPGLAKAKI